MKVVIRPDRQFEVDFGSLDLTLTPQLAVETGGGMKWSGR